LTELVQFFGAGSDVIVYRNHGYDQPGVYVGYDRRTVTSGFRP
jgi:hypothetical protein